MYHLHVPVLESTSFSWPPISNIHPTKAARVRKHLGTESSKSNEGRQEKNGGVKRRDMSAEELDRETGEEQTTVGRTRWKDGRRQTSEESDRVYVSRAGGGEGGQGWDGRTVLREMWGRQERRKTGRRRRQRRVEKNIRWGGEQVAGSTSPLTNGKRGREREIHTF